MGELGETRTHTTAPQLPRIRKLELSGLGKDQRSKFVLKQLSPTGPQGQQSNSSTELIGNPAVEIPLHLSLIHI